MSKYQEGGPEHLDKWRLEKLVQNWFKISRPTTGSQGLIVNGGHKKNVWEIMQCPEYVLKCNKSVHLPAPVSFLCLLGDLWEI